MKYKNYNDYELISMVRENDGVSYYNLFSKYQPIIKNIASEFYEKFSSYGSDYDDFLQECYIAFQDALNSYDYNKGVLFYTFVNLCIKRHMISYTRKISHLKINNENNYVLIDNYEIVDEKAYIDNINNFNLICDVVKECMFSLDLTISAPFELKMNNFSFNEISILLDIPVSSARYKIDRMRKIIIRKLKRLYLI